MARICPLFSGSDGNSTYISGDEGAVLVDAGASFKGLSSAILNCGGSIEQIKGIFITHEHSDHIKGLKTLLKKTGIPVFASKKTLETLLLLDVIPPNILLNPMAGALELCGITAERFATSHDCEGSSGYTFTLKSGAKVGVCTDLGIVTEDVRKALCGCSTLLLESNHNIDMLKKGPYPPSLKMRILSDKGHLSNNSCAAELPELLKGGTTRFILAHISRNNNTPLLALSSARACLADVGAENLKDYTVCAASPTGNEVVFF